MKTRDKLQGMYWILSLFLLGACSEEDGSLSVEFRNRVVHFVMTVAGETRTVSYPSVDGVATRFTENDEVGLFAWRHFADGTEMLCGNRCYTALAQKDNSLVWNTEEPVPSILGKYSFRAYYPYNRENTGDGKIVHRILSDQSKVENYSQSDLLVAVKEDVEVTGKELDIRLDFSHQLSLVQITFTGAGINDMLNAVRLLKMKSEVALDFTQSGVTHNLPYTVITREGFVLNSIKMLKISEVYGINPNQIKVIYRAVVPEQEIPSGTPFLQFELNGKQYNLSHTESIKFNAGTRRNIIVTVGTEGTSMAIDGDGFDIGDWEPFTDDNSITGRAENQGDAPQALQLIPDIGITTFLTYGQPGSAHIFPDSNVIGWYVLAGISNTRIMADVEEDLEKGYVLNYELDNWKGTWHGLLYCFGQCMNRRPTTIYRLTFDLKTEGTKVYAGLFDNVFGTKYAFRPISEIDGGVGVEHPWLNYAVRLSNSNGVWNSYTIDFDLSQSTPDIASEPVYTFHTSVFEQLTLAIGGGKARTSLANVKLEPLL